MCFLLQLEKLVSLVEQQSSSGIRERTSFLVLTRTLLLGLGELSETQHLLTAQRVFALLEPPLLELITGDDDLQVSEHHVPILHFKIKLLSISLKFIYFFSKLNNIFLCRPHVLFC